MKATLGQKPSGADGPGANRMLRLKTVGLVLVTLLVVGGIVRMLIKPPAQEALEAGNRLAGSGRLAEAETQWKEAVRRDPNCADAWAALADSYRSQQAFPAAIGAYRHLIRLKPHLSEVYKELGSCVVQAGNANSDVAYEQAIKDLANDPNDLAALTIASTVLIHRDDQKTQLMYLRRMVQLQPDNVDFLITLAQTLVNAHLYDEARPLLDKLVGSAPDSPAAFDLRGQSLLFGDGSQQALTQAEGDFTHALQLNATSPLIHLNLARVYNRTGQPQKAIAELRTAVESLPYSPDIYFELARAYTLENKPDRAAAAQARFVVLRQSDDRQSSLTKRCSAFPDNFEYAMELAELLLQKGAPGKAGYYINRALSLRPDDPRAKAALKEFTAMIGAAQGQPGSGQPGSGQP